MCRFDAQRASDPVQRTQGVHPLAAHVIVSACRSLLVLGVLVSWRIISAIDPHLRLSVITKFYPSKRQNFALPLLGSESPDFELAAMKGVVKGQQIYS
jgi:hypothetical protein